MKNRSFFFVLFTAAAFSSLEPASKLLSGQVNPLALTFYRFLIGSIMLMPIALRALRRHAIRLTEGDLTLLSAEGILCVSISMVFLQIAVYEARSAALIAVIFCSNSVFTVLLAAWILREKLNASKIIAVVLCMLGVAVNCTVSNGESVKAVLFAVLAAISMSAFTVLGRRTMNKLPPQVQVGLSFSIGTLVLAVVLACMKIPLAPPASVREILIVLYLGIVVTGLGYLSYFCAIEGGGAIMASMIFFIKPVLAPMMSFLFLGTLNASDTFLISVGLILAGSCIIFIPNFKKLFPRDRKQA